MKKIIAFVLIAAPVLPAVLQAQESAAGKGGSAPAPASPAAEMVSEGNRLLGKGHFNAALNVWLKIVESDPSNADAQFKTGMCYRNSLDEQAKALPFFQKAASNMTGSYDFFGKNNKQAPYDALYFMAETYRVMVQPDSALYYYIQYRDKFNGQPPINVDAQIIACVNARLAFKAPRDVKVKNLGRHINSPYAEANPVATIDNSVIFFSSRRPGKNGTGADSMDPVTGKYSEDIYFSSKDAGGNWQAPQPFPHNTSFNERPLSLSPDGLTLYLCREDKGKDFNIYESKFTDKKWTVPQPVNEVNSSYNETGFTVSSDGKFAYFVSDREGGFGKSDLYYCERKASGGWSSPKNMGPAVNSAYNEFYPFIHPNGKTLFFSSNGFKNRSLGGYDILYAELKSDNSWSEPQNMGFPINSTRDDINYYITGGGSRYYTALYEDQSFDLHRIEGGAFEVENTSMGAEVVRLTTEMSVTEVMEVQKTVEKEVQVVETVEKEIIREKEVPVIQMADAENEAEKARAEADKAMAEAEKAKAEAEKAKADAEILKAKEAIALAERAKADIEIAKSNAEKAKADAEREKAAAKRAEAQALIAAAEKAKADAAARKSEAERAKADAIKAQADANRAAAENAKAQADLRKKELEAKLVEAAQIKLEADKVKAETAKAQAEKAKADAENAKALADAKKKEAEVRVAEAEKAKQDAAAAKAAADKEKAEASRAQAEATRAAARARLAEAEKIKAEAVQAQADAVAKKAEAEKAKSDATKAVADAERSKAEAVKSKAMADSAAAQKAKADAIAAQAAAEHAKAESAKAAAEAQRLAAEAEKAKADAERARVESEKSRTDSERAKAEADKAKLDLEKARADAEIAAKERAKLEAEKAKSDAERAKAELKAARKRK